MDSVERKKRMEELQINNRRNVLRKEISQFSTNLDSDCFLTIDETIETTERIYEKIETINIQEELIKDKSVAVEKLINTKDLFDGLLCNKAILLHQYDREVGAVIIELKDFYENISWFLDFIGFTRGYRDLILVEKNLDFGICIERYEYKNNLIIWGFK